MSNPGPYFSGGNLALWIIAICFILFLLFGENWFTVNAN